MANTYDSQIFADKLTKLTTSQGCIESISHWCVAHIKHAKQIVETWNKQFYSSPHEQRLGFLYLANDILQNSRRRSAEFVTEFWKVLPDSLNDVKENGDKPTREQALRLINIWVERSVFGSKSQILKENYLKRDAERNLKPAGSQTKAPGKAVLDQITLGFQAVYGSQLDEDVISRKCRNAICFVVGVDKDPKVGRVCDSVRKEKTGQHAILRDCIEQLRVVKSSREHLVTLLRDALQEEENKLNQVRDLVKEAEDQHLKQAESGSSHLYGATSSASGQVLVRHSGNYSRQLPSSSKINTGQFSPLAENPRLVTAATSSAQVTLVRYPFALQEVVGSSDVHDSANDCPFAKRVRNDIDHHHQPSNIPPPPTSMQPPTPPSSPPPTPPPPTQPYDQVPRYPQTAMPRPRGPYGYGTVNPPQPPLYPPLYPRYSGGFTFAPPSNAYYSYSIEGGSYGQPLSHPPRPMGPW